MRLKGGDPAVFARLDEEIEALEAEGIPYQVVPGITAASAAAAAIGQSLTKRGRNASFRILTGHDVDGLRRARLADAGAARPDRGDLHGRQGGDLRPRPAAHVRRRRRHAP